MSSAAVDRRAFLSLRGLNRATGGALGALVPDAATGAGTQQHLCVARRAMACEFSVLFPAHFLAGVDAGCAALNEVERLERKLSVYIGDSDVSHVNRCAHERPVVVDHELFELLSLAARLTEQTDGAFDIAAGALVKAWGFFRGPRRVPASGELREALAQSGMAQVLLERNTRRVSFARPGVEINLGSIGKGYAIDRALDTVADSFAAPSALVQGGLSSVRAMGDADGDERGWRVSINSPWDDGPPLATVRLRNRALGTSGSAQQHFVSQGRRYGHVLDPRTGWPAEALVSATALAPTAAQADALATAFYVMGEEATKRYCATHTEVSALLVTHAPSREAARVVPVGLSDRDVTIVNTGDGS